ncbi:MAG TPA: carbon-nitrogen hydrolase family protein [Candidatus Nanoarchaeia archaeon]|nr:carbon-nitrogen hydrolase family protein [Candidatus Nanoarchaeia archaeon]
MVTAMVKVAVAQIKVTSKIDTNLRKILDSIDKAKSKKADIVCFPEVCLNPTYKSLDVSKQIKAIQERCKQRSIWVIIGSHVPAGKKLKNSVFLIDRSGKIKYRYDKIHLWISEENKITPGKVSRVIDTEFGKIGVINCQDFVFPSFIQKLSKAGAKIIFCPMYIFDFQKDADVLRKIPLVRAFENICYFITSAAFAPGTLAESFICHPQRVLKKIEHKEGIIYANLNLKEIDPLRKYYGHLT